MDVATIAMPADLARQKYDEYRQALAGTEPSDEDRGIMLGYRALASGKALLDLHAVFRACPLNDRGLPRLAVARADWTWSFFGRSWRDAGRTTFAAREQIIGRRGGYGRHRIVLPDGVVRVPAGSGARGKALVPLIPPNLRPAAGLHNYLILFEAEWQPVPPKDPLLLRPLHGSLCVVLAAWDLTSLERAVLAGRLTERPA
jgi:hypothetical protein